MYDPEYQKQYRAKNKAAIKKRHADYYAKNRAKENARNSAYAKAHAADILRNARKHRASNKAKCAARVKAWMERNKDHVKARKKVYYAKNPHKLREQTNRRRARELGARIGDCALISKWEKSWRSKPRVTCYWCTKTFRGKDCHTDHIVPLEKGGAHAIENVCISCAPCNLSKQAKPLEKWNAQIESPTLF